VAHDQRISKAHAEGGDDSTVAERV